MLAFGSTKVRRRLWSQAFFGSAGVVLFYSNLPEPAFCFLRGPQLCVAALWQLMGGGRPDKTAGLKESRHTHTLSRSKCFCGTFKNKRVWPKCCTYKWSTNPIYQPSNEQAAPLTLDSTAVLTHHPVEPQEEPTCHLPVLEAASSSPRHEGKRNSRRKAKSDPRAEASHTGSAHEKKWRGDKNPSRQTVRCTYISLQQPQFRKASFQAIKTPREHRLIIRTRWWLRGLWGRHRGGRVVQQVLLSDGNSAAARREDYRCSGTRPRCDLQIWDLSESVCPFIYRPLLTECLHAIFIFH